MSVSLFYKDQQSGEERVVPISTERVFEEYWQPAALELGLKWIPLFQSGLPLSAEDIPEVIEELTRLRLQLRAKKSGKSPEDEYVAERLERLISELEAIAAKTDAEAYIG
jgi:hypothetical protein